MGVHAGKVTTELTGPAPLDAVATVRDDRQSVALVTVRRRPDR